VPFDGRYIPLYLAAIAGLCGLGLRPRGAVEIAGPQRRLERIHNLLGRCSISVHDLSRVELSRGAPRFNMPFELGLAVEMSRHQKHEWFVLEARPHRLQRSLSDLNGNDPLIHGGTPAGLLQVLADVFDRPRTTRVPLEPIFDHLRRQAPILSRRYGGLYTRGAFADLVWWATDFAAQFRRG
jgi:hypothetical protein